MAALGVQFGAAGKVDLRLEWTRYLDVGDEGPEATGERDYDSFILGVLFRLTPRDEIEGP